MGLGQRLNFCHLPTVQKEITSVTHTKDFLEKNVPNLPDVKEKSYEIATFI
jgi:hypothetical protein